MTLPADFNHHASWGRAEHVVPYIGSASATERTELFYDAMLNGCIALYIHGSEHDSLNGFRRILDALVAHDVEIPPPYSGTNDLDCFLKHMTWSPITHSVVWCWCHDFGPNDTYLAGDVDPIPVTEYFPRDIAAILAGPLPINDPANRNWLAQRAVAQMDRPWSMRLLAALGAAA